MENIQKEPKNTRFSHGDKCCLTHEPLSARNLPPGALFVKPVSIQGEQNGNQFCFWLVNDLFQQIWDQELGFHNYAGAIYPHVVITSFQ
jgi:hypothetical protein